MSELNLDIVLKSMTDKEAFPFLLFLYGEYSSNAEDLKHKALEFASQGMVDAYDEMVVNRCIIKDKIFELWNAVNARSEHYEFSYNQIEGMPVCNNCKKFHTCEYAPQPGQKTRINCPLFLKKGDK